MTLWAQEPPPEVFRIQIDDVTAEAPLTVDPLSDGSHSIKGFADKRSLRVTSLGALLEVRAENVGDPSEIKIQLGPETEQRVSVCHYRQDKKDWLCGPKMTGHSYSDAPIWIRPSDAYLIAESPLVEMFQKKITPEQAHEKLAQPFQKFTAAFGKMTAGEMEKIETFEITPKIQNLEFKVVGTLYFSPEDPLLPPAPPQAKLESMPLENWSLIAAAVGAALGLIVLAWRLLRKR